MDSNIERILKCIVKLNEIKFNSFSKAPTYLAYRLFKGAGMGRLFSGPVHSQTISAPRGAYSPAAISVHTSSAKLDLNFNYNNLLFSGYVLIQDTVILLLGELPKFRRENTGEALSDLLGTRYGEGDDAGEVSMTTIKMTTVGLIGVGEHHEQCACIPVLMNVICKFLKIASLLKFTGAVGTSTTFYALLNILQSHPDIQDKIYQEVVREVGTNRLRRTGRQGEITLHSCCDLRDPEVYFYCSTWRSTQNLGRHTVVRDTCSSWDTGRRKYFTYLMLFTGSIRYSIYLRSKFTLLYRWCSTLINTCNFNCCLVLLILKICALWNCM